LDVQAGSAGKAWFYGAEKILQENFILLQGNDVLKRIIYRKPKRPLPSPLAAVSKGVV
jgi:hypothetical protein